MNAYDFDETIYDGDSTRDFYFYCLKKYPQIMRAWPKQLWHFALFATGFIKKTTFKERFYRFFRYVPDMEKAVSDFWDSHFCKIKPWYLEEKRSDDVIISASPAFLLAIPCKKLGIPAPIASRVDIETGKYTGENCYGEEKPPRFFEVYPGGKIDAFFSDSLSDTPMAQLTENRVIVRGNDRMRWEDYKPSAFSRMKKTFFSPSFLRFLLVGGASTIITTIFSALYDNIITPVELAFSLGYLSTTLCSFFANCMFTFKKKPSFSRFLKYVVSYIPNYLVQVGCVALFHTILGMPEILSYLIAAIIGVPVTYLLMKIFTFKK